MSKFNMNVEYFDTLANATKWIRSAEKAIDWHNYQTAVHEVFLVTGDLNAATEAFAWLAARDQPDAVVDDGYWWEIIDKNTEYVGEVNYRYAFDGGAHYFENNKPHPSYNYIGADNRRHEVAGCFHF